MANNLVSIAIVLVLLSYLLIFFTYVHDIDQCNSIIDEKELALVSCDCPIFLQSNYTNKFNLNDTITNDGNQS